MRLVVLALSALSLLGCDSVGIDAAPGEAQALRPWPEMLDVVNAARASGQTCGDTRYPSAGPLVWNDRLDAAATTHTVDMFEHGYFDHAGTDRSRVGDRVARAGYSWRVVGENIAWGHTSVSMVVSAWLASPGHCRNLMDPRFNEMGAAEQGKYWTQVFAVSR